MGPARPWERRPAENVPLHASATRVPQEVEGVTRAAVQHDSGSGPGLPVVVGRPVDRRRDAGAVRDFSGDRETLGPGRHAGYGYCASYSRYYWGLKLYLVCAGDGMPIMWCLAHPKIGEREVVAALLARDHHLIREGQVMLADTGFSGKDFAAATAAAGIQLLRPDRKDETYRNGNLGGVRQWIESVNQTLKGQLDLERHGGRTTHGVFTRVAQRLLAMAAGIWRNWATGVQAKRSLTAYDHRPSRNHSSSRQSSLLNPCNEIPTSVPF